MRLPLWEPPKSAGSRGRRAAISVHAGRAVTPTAGVVSESPFRLTPRILVVLIACLTGIDIWQDFPTLRQIFPAAGERRPNRAVPRRVEPLTSGHGPRFRSPGVSLSGTGVFPAAPWNRRDAAASQGLVRAATASLRSSCWLVPKARFSSARKSGTVLLGSGGGSPLAWRSPGLATGTVAAIWPTCNILCRTHRSPPPMVLHFRVERGPERIRELRPPHA